MYRRNYRDMVGGGILTFVGFAFAWYALQEFELGTPQKMGPAMFPAALGFLLGGMGAIMAVAAYFRHGPVPEVRARVSVCVLSGLAAFALLLSWFGLIPAIMGVTVISSFAERKVRPITVAVLSVTLCLMAWLIFSVGLGLPITLLKWPF